MKLMQAGQWSQNTMNGENFIYMGCLQICEFKGECINIVVNTKLMISGFELWNFNSKFIVCELIFIHFKKWYEQGWRDLYVDKHLDNMHIDYKSACIGG